MRLKFFAYKDDAATLDDLREAVVDTERRRGAFSVARTRHNGEQTKTRGPAETPRKCTSL